MRLSIISIHLDQVDALDATLQSLLVVEGQERIEWLVIDGGTEARDGVQADVLEQVRRRADLFVSEPDHGIYDAMNKGAALASGDYVLFLNAGDCLHPEFDLKSLCTLADAKTPAMIWGVSWDRGDDGEAYPVHTRPPAWLRYGPVLAHQAVVFRREVIGPKPYDTSYRIAADYELICRIYQAGETIVRLDMPVCIYRLGGESARDTGETLWEEARARGLHFGVPSALNVPLVAVKHSIWRLSQRFPGFRKALRKWI